jgi:hypothetical protein
MATKFVCARSSSVTVGGAPDMAGRAEDAAFVQIGRDGETVVDWTLRRPGQRRPSRDEAEADAMAYAVRLVDHRPFGGPPSDVPEAA